jgi:lipid-A-disaccharide synthase
MSAGPTAGRPLRLALIAGEHSGDQLGARLMAALRQSHPGKISFTGIGGHMMEAEGLASQFPIDDVAVMGPAAIVRHLPRILRRVREAAAGAVAAKPDVLVIIDAPEFTHRVARRFRRALPTVPIIDYVSPSVWAWRPGRAPRMRTYVDHVMALLPFEPAVHERLGGPACTYVGHPLVDRLPAISALDPGALAQRLGLDADRPVLVVLPGSRRSEIERLMQPFGETVAALQRRGRPLQVIVPTMPAVRPALEAHLDHWPVRPHIVEGEDDKWRAFKLARAALAASGTVTLELAMAGAPMIVAYRVDRFAILFRPFVRPPHFALSNLVLEERAFPELMQELCEPEGLATALAGIIDDTPERTRQLAALRRIPERMVRPGLSPSQAAADIVLRHAARGRAASI